LDEYDRAMKRVSWKLEIVIIAILIFAVAIYLLENRDAFSTKPRKSESKDFPFNKDYEIVEVIYEIIEDPKAPKQSILLCAFFTSL